MIYYNPMSKEFQNERKRLGLTGNQLIQKYRNEGKLQSVFDIKHKKIEKTPRICCNNKVHDTYIDSRGIECWYKHKCEKTECTGYICSKCWNKDDYIERFGCGHRRTGSLKDPKHIFGDNILELACILYGWDDLNKKHDNYTSGTPIDCYDPKTGLYHQVQGRHYNSIYQWWNFSGFEDEWEKEYEIMVCFCVSEDGNTVERIYKFLRKEIDKGKGITIIKNPMNTRGTSPIIPWYEEYRETNEEELKKANEIWKKIIEKKTNNRKEDK